MNKDQVLAKAIELECLCVQQVTSGTYHGSPEAASAQHKIVKDHLIQLVADGSVRFIQPGPGEVEKWEVI